MANKYIIDNPSVANREKAKRYYFNALRRFASHTIKSQETLLGEFFRAIQEFFSSLGRPRLGRSHTISPASPPDSDKYNETIQALNDDIQIAYAEQNAIESGILSHFNYAQTERLRLEKLLQKAKDKLDVYLISSKSRETNEIWIKDSFKTMAKIDTDATVSTQMAYVDTSGGYITLPVANRIRPWNTIDDIESIRVETPNLPSTSTMASPVEDRIAADGRMLEIIRERRRNINWEDHYQGKMYGLINQQGSILGEDGIRVDESNISARLSSPVYKILFPTEVDTFWEYELVVLSGEEGQWTELAPITDVIDQTPGSTRSILASELRRGFITVDPLLEYSPGKTTGTYVWTQEARPDANTDYILVVNLIITLKTPKYMNSLVIEPHTFGHQVYPTLTGIAIASEAAGDFVAIPQFNRQNAAVLSPDSVDSGSRNDVSMSSIQHFIFPTRLTKSIKISFTQDTPYQIGYTMGLASRNWVFRYTKPDRSSDLIEYTEYIWVDILGKTFMKSLSDIVSSEIRTGMLEQAEFERRFEQLTGIDIRTENISENGTGQTEVRRNGTERGRRHPRSYR